MTQRYYPAHAENLHNLKYKLHNLYFHIFKNNICTQLCFTLKQNVDQDPLTFFNLNQKFFAVYLENCKNKVFFEK